MSALTDCYATITTPFGALGPYYDDEGHRGTDYERDANEPILAYDDMRVEYVGYTHGLGHVIGLRRLTLGGYAGYAHVIAAAAVGTTIAKGAALAVVADYDNLHGSLWSGPHIHTTESDVSAAAAALGLRPLTDPAPTIDAAIAAASIAGGTGTIITPTPTPEEDDMRLLYITDSVDGNGIPGWALLNPRNGEVRTLRNDRKPATQEKANGWARVWGSARSCTRADLGEAQKSIAETA